MQVVDEVRAAIRIGGLCAAAVAPALEHRRDGAGRARELPVWQTRGRSCTAPRGVALAVVVVAQPCARGQVFGVGATGAGRYRARVSADVRRA